MKTENLTSVIQDPRNPSYKYRHLENENINNTEKFNKFIKKNKLKKIFIGTLWGEGPAYIPNINTLVWSDIPNNRMLKLVDGKVSEYKNPSNFCNGNTIDNEQNLISCSHGGRCLYLTDNELNTTVLIDNYSGKNLIHLMMFVFQLMIISILLIHLMEFYQIEGYPGQQEHGGCNVFSYNPNTNKLEVVIDDLIRPNGITLSPDENKLYVADTGENIKHLYSYDLIDGKVSNKKLIYDFKPFFSDGFRCDKDGNIWTSAGKAIKCFDKNFSLIGQIKIPELVSNCEFGGPEGNILFITATTSLYSIELNQQGAKWI